MKSDEVKVQTISLFYSKRVFYTVNGGWQEQLRDLLRIIKKIIKTEQAWEACWLALRLV